MNFLKKFWHSATILTLTLVLSLFSFSPIAMAGRPLDNHGSYCVDIRGGGFSADVTVDVPEPTRIGSANISLPQGETGTIDEIVITNTEIGVREYFCQGVRVANGTDLISSCGRPAYLWHGLTTFQGRGSNFQPEPNVRMCVRLSD